MAARRAVSSAFSLLKHERSGEDGMSWRREPLAADSSTRPGQRRNLWAPRDLSKCQLRPGLFRGFGLPFAVRGSISRGRTISSFGTECCGRSQGWLPPVSYCLPWTEPSPR